MHSHHRKDRNKDNMSQVRGSFVPVELLGQFSEVEIQSPGVQLNLQRGGIENLTLVSPAQVAQSARLSNPYNPFKLPWRHKLP